MARAAETLQALGNGATAGVRRLVDLALPPLCPSCDSPDVASVELCSDCWSGLHFLDNRGCAACQIPLPSTGEGMLCGTCLAKRPRHDGIFAATAYGDVAARIALKLKYGRRTALAKMMARAMARHLTDDAQQWTLVPVPLHRWRLWNRGFNQSALIAQELAQLSGAKIVPDLLRRTRQTAPLKGMNHRQRAEMLSGAISVQSGREQHVSSGARVILVDDVVTSGATSLACVRALKKAGAGEVRILCWARVLPSSLTGIDA